MAAPIRKAKKRPAFKPQLGALAPAISWQPASESESLLARMKEQLASHRDRVVAGLNAASRCVENNEAVALVMARPPVLRLVQHVPLLAAVKGVPLLCLSVPCLSGALPHLRSCLVFAIKVRHTLPLPCHVGCEDLFTFLTVIAFLQKHQAPPEGDREEAKEVAEMVKLVRERGTSIAAPESWFNEPAPVALRLHRTRVERRGPRRTPPEA
jgi:hypothetical protein